MLALTKTLTILTPLFLPLALTSCEDDDGVDAMEDAADDAGDAMEDAAEDTGDAIEDATDG